MFLFLLHYLVASLLVISNVNGAVIIQDSGVYNFVSDDIALIFFVTLENGYDHEIHVTVCNVKCTENDIFGETSDHMFLLGGYMGAIRHRSVKNITLIYPNLYLRNRMGKCTVSVTFDTSGDQEAQNEMQVDVPFRTANCIKPPPNEKDLRCQSADLEPLLDCSPVDCTIKYSARRSFFHKEYKMCQVVPECAPNTVYNPKSNNCRKLHTPVCKSDLEMIENGQVEKCHTVTNMVLFQCHHGAIDNQTGDCMCDEGWTTTSCYEGAYHPALPIYHMCNIGLDSWQQANREKLLMTILVVVIFTLAVAAKMLLAVCLLNWCCHFIRRGRKIESEDSVCCMSSCAKCGDPRCGAEQKCSSKTNKVSFSDGEAMLTDTDFSGLGDGVTTTEDEKSEESEEDTNVKSYLND